MRKEQLDADREGFEIYQFNEAIFKGSEVCRNARSNKNRNLKIQQIPPLQVCHLHSIDFIYRGDIFSKL